MTFDWSSIAKQIIGLGLPVLGTALGGPLGAAAAAIIAKWLGLPTTATPMDINNALNSNPNDVLIQKLKSAEAEYIAAVQAEADVAQVELEQTGATTRAELTAAGLLGGKLGRFIVALQASWRPVFAYQTIVECTVMGFVASYEILTSDVAILGAVLQYQGVIIAYWSMKFGLLGVYSWGRTREKLADAGGILLEAIKKK